MSLGFLSAVIDSTSRGLIHGNAPPGLTSTWVPSTMNRGPSDASLNEVGPIMRTMMPPLGPGVTDTPDSFPASICRDREGATFSQFLLRHDYLVSTTLIRVPLKV